MALLDDALDKEDAPMHAVGVNNEEADEEDLVQGIAFATLGRNGTKPHLMVSCERTEILKGIAR
jgi:hypothetical protein